MIGSITVHYENREDILPYLIDKGRFSSLFDIKEIHEDVYIDRVWSNLKNMSVRTGLEEAYVRGSLDLLYLNLIDTSPFGYKRKEKKYEDTDITFSQTISVLDQLSSVIENIEEQPLSRLTLGLNIDMCSKQFNVFRNPHLHKEKIPSRFKIFEKFNQCKFKRSDFEFNIIDFGDKNILDKSIFRFELLLTEKRIFNMIGINTLKDLRSKEKLNSLFKLFLKRFDELIILNDFINDPRIPENDRLLLLGYTGHAFWYTLRYERGCNGGRKARKEQKKFKALINKYDLDSIKMELRDCLMMKFQALIES